MCTYDDYDGVYFSLQAMRLYHEVLNNPKETQIIVIDNNPDSSHGKAVKDLCAGWLNHVEYVPYTAKRSTSNRNLIFERASGKYTISMDCHVIFPPGSIDALIKHYAKTDNCQQLVQGPMLYDNLEGMATHFKPTWGADMYGQWDFDKENYNKQEPFKIPMQGLGVFSCQTKNWLGFNKKFRGFGGEEGYIHEKFRKHGDGAICLPQFKWLHRFARPNGVKYPLSLEDRVWNYFIGWFEIKEKATDPFIQEIYNNFSKRIPHKIDEIVKTAYKRSFKKDITEQELEYLRSPLDEKDLTQQKETANVT